jgi:hypothetical protein
MTYRKDTEEGKKDVTEIKETKEKKKAARQGSGQKDRQKRGEE